MDRIPKRIVCLTAETAEMLYALGAADRVVGVSCYAPPPPDGVPRPVVSVFTTFRYDVIESLRPDLVLAFSDLQAEAVTELARRGYPVFLTNQRTIGQVFDTLLALGRLAGRTEAAVELAQQLERQLDAARRKAAQYAARPTVYFEEWDDPMITGIGWVSELIEAAGGRDAFKHLSARPSATQRIIEPQAVLDATPDIIIASWCGKRARLDQICSRVGWQALPAVRQNAVHEVAAADCLCPGISLITRGLPRFQHIIEQWQQSNQSAAPAKG